ncbi:XRE family transcriptional regulator [Psychrobacillus antarcticus]|uniref:XRE family transcriptional regulator n=1 Tax=Psychrobacillus antarcticus TaxID=2879115 RepID=UPI0024086383|nr:XRE family transcriptional regulator [Psychrobacillus antarcticus]
MRKPPKNLLNTSDLVAKHPELNENLHGLGSLYGKIIFACRMEQGLTQKELAGKALIGLKTITRAEGGFENLGTTTYNAIFRALGLSTAGVAELMYQMTREQMDSASEHGVLV